MKINSVRSNAIKSYIEPRKPEANLFARVQLEGKIQTFPVYSIPLDKLYFNIRNGRFAAELRGRERQLGRKLDALNEDDSLIIRELLLKQSPKDTEALREDLERHGQIDPGIITHDGAVINANRRLAVISTLYKETGLEKWNYLKVAVLPESVGDKDLWRIEAGLQFGKDLRADYGPVNELLKLREGIQCGLNAREISISLQGRFTDEEVKKRLTVLDLIDDYLECINKQGDYEHITREQLMEKFNSLSYQVIESLKKKEAVSSAELAKITEAAFALIDKTDLRHWDIRKLAHIATQPNAYAAFRKELPRHPLSASGDALEEAFKVGADLVEDQKLKDKPARLLRQAISAVQSIDTSSQLLKTTEVQNLLEALIEMASQLREKNKATTK